MTTDMPGDVPLNAGLGPLPRPAAFDDHSILPTAGKYSDAQMHAYASSAVAATRRLFRAALLEEAAQWTGDYRAPVHRGLCAAAKRAGVLLTMDDCYQATKRV
jgi:hypothetical protein